MKRSLCFLIAVFAFTAMAAGAASSRLNGYISDSMCGAKHMGTGAACVKKCIASGQKPVFVDAANKEVWAIDNPDAVKPVYYGAHVIVHATMDESAKSVHIDSIHTAQ